MIQLTKKTSSIALIAGTFLLSLIFFAILLSSLLFFCKVPISAFHLIGATVFSIVACYLFVEKSWKKLLIGCLIGIVVVIFSTMLCCFAYDWSWDGNAYHKPMTAFLRHGWNPIYQTFYDFADEQFPLLSSYDSNYLDAYPKGSEIFGACIYAIINNIEAGKSITLISNFAVSFLCYGFLCQIKSIKRWQAAICAIFFAVNPVTVSQAFTYYIDGTMWNIILVCAFACLYLTFAKGGHLQRLCLFLIFICINIGFNLKFSAVIFLAAICGSLFAYWCVDTLRSRSWKTESKSLLTRFFWLAAAVLSGFCITGASSYVINTVRHRNPFYSIIGDGSNEIITTLMPEPYKDKSHLYRFVHSLFSKTGYPDFKMPFTFHADELRPAAGYDTLVAGWGIFFSGLLLVSCAVLVIALIDFRKKQPKVCQVTLLLGVLQIGLVTVIPGLCWARYYVLPLYIPVCALLYLFAKANTHLKFSTHAAVLGGFVIALLLLNLSTNFSKTDELLQQYKTDRQNLDQLKTLSQTYAIEISCREPYYDYNFYGRLFTLYDNGITNFTYAPQISDNATGQLLSPYPIYYKVNGMDDGT